MSIVTKLSGRSVRNVESMTAGVRRLAARAAVRTAVEALESRRLLTNVVVTSALDNANDADVTGPTVTLRQAINYENANGGGAITFAPALAGQTITLGGTQLEIAATASPTNIDASSVGGVTISANNASRVLLIDENANVTLSKLTIANGNSSDSSGGGISNVGATVTMTDCVVTNNTTRGGQFGGGIINQGSMSLIRCTVSNNGYLAPPGFLGTLGGGIFSGASYDGSINDYKLTIIGSTISGNYGGGIFDKGSTVVVANSTIASNVTNAAGSGIRSQGALSITNSTIADTNDGSSSLLYCGLDAGYLVMNNSIVAGATAAGGADVAFGSPNQAPVSGSNNLIGDGSSLGYFTNSFSGDPKLGPLANNGGPTQTMALLPGSPAINAGSNASAVDANGNPLANDQRGPGYPRIVGGTVDIGAYELLRPSLVVTTTADEDNGNADPSSGTGTSLREAIAYAETLSNNPTITFASNLNGQTITLGGSQLEITGGTFSIDAGSLSGGVTINANNASRVFKIDVDTTVSMSGLTITGGNEYNGGGIFNEGNLTLTYVKVANNYGSFQGGGIHNFSGASLTLVNDLIVGNTVNSAGGGIFTRENFSATNTTIAGNTAGGGGGGLYCVGARVALTNVTISGNSAPGASGGIRAGNAEIVLNNTIVANQLRGGDWFINAGDQISGSNNLIGDGTALSFFSNSLSGDPKLGPLADNGGPTQTMALLPGSPAIDAGSNAVAVDANGNPLTTDQRGSGFIRVANGKVDIGAFEVQQVATNTAVTVNPASPTYGQSISFTAAVTANGGATPTGSVQFYLDGSTTPFSTAPVGANGQATSGGISTLNAGGHTVTARFVPTGNFVTSSNSANFTVAKAASTLSVGAATVAYNGTTSLSATLATAGGAPLANRTVSFSLNGKFVGTGVTNASGVATLSGASAAGISPGVYASGVQASYAGDANVASATSAASLTVKDAAITGCVDVLNARTVGLLLGTFSQSRTGAAAGDFVVSVNWGDGSAVQTATVIADPFHPGQFLIVGPAHTFAKARSTYTVKVTISTTAKFGLASGATATLTDIVLT